MGIEDMSIADLRAFRAHYYEALARLEAASQRIAELEAIGARLAASNGQLV